MMPAPTTTAPTSSSSSGAFPPRTAPNGQGGSSSRFVNGIVLAAATALAAAGVSYYVRRGDATGASATATNTPAASSSSPTTTNASPSTTNTALIFIKPHGQTPKVRAFVEKELLANGLRIIREGQLNGTQIGTRGTIDAHYAAIGLYAMKFPPRELKSMLTAERAAAFEAKYGISFDDAVAAGVLMNAAECMRRYGWNSERVSTEFEASKALTMFKVAPGCYTVKLANGAIVVNGFYLRMRAEYVDPKALVTWMVVEWDEQNLSWANFRGKVLGCTDPTKAPPMSIRSKILNNAEGLGLSFTPTMAANCVHGSASPLEGLNERMVWTKSSEGGADNGGTKSTNTTIASRLAADAYGKQLISSGIPTATLERMLGNAKVDGVPIFDIVEDMDSSKCTRKLLELAAKL